MKRSRNHDLAVNLNSLLSECLNCVQQFLNDNNTDKATAHQIGIANQLISLINNTSVKNVSDKIPNIFILIQYCIKLNISAKKQSCLVSYLLATYQKMSQLIATDSTLFSNCISSFIKTNTPENTEITLSFDMVLHTNEASSILEQAVKLRAYDITRLVTTLHLKEIQEITTSQINNKNLLAKACEWTTERDGAAAFLNLLILPFSIREKVDVLIQLLKNNDTTNADNVFSSFFRSRSNNASAQVGLVAELLNNNGRRLAEITQTNNLSILVKFIKLYYYVKNCFRFREGYQLPDLLRYHCDKKNIIQHLSYLANKQSETPLEVLEFIDYGAHSCVFRGTYNQKKVALKVLSEPFGKNSFINEVTILKTLNPHKNIIGFIKFIDISGLTAIALQHIVEGNLRNRIHKEGLLPDNKIATILIGIATALAHAHNNQVIICDLKAENVLLDNDLNPKLTDFGLSTVFADNEPKSTRGYTLGYSPPEIIINTRAEFTKQQAEKIDSYAYGFLFWETFTKRTVTEGYKSIEKFASDVLNKDYRPPSKLLKSKAKINLFQICVDKNPNNRPNATNILNELNTKIFK